MEVGLGMGAALAKGRLDYSWFEAWARYECQVDELEYRTNSARADAAALERLKRGSYGPGGMRAI